MVIYKATNKANGKSYIGQTIYSLKYRKDGHLREVNCGRTNNYFHNALNKYGSNNFNWEVIEECETKEELDEMEFHYIKQYDTYSNGYNLTFGGEGNPGYKASEETRKKMSEMRKGDKHPMWGKNHPNKGKKIHSEEFKKKSIEILRKANLGRRLSKEHKQKISEAMKGRVFSPEHRSKIGEANKRRKQLPKGKK